MKTTNMFKKIIISSVLFCFVTTNAIGQCAMCRAVLESEESGVKAEAINNGIVYLMAIPYILIGIVGYAIYKLRYQKRN